MIQRKAIATRLIVLWVGAFLHGRQQRVRVEQSVSDWLPVNGGVPQGTRVGSIVFLFMVNDLLKGRRRVKFVDDTASWECCHVTGRDSSLQDVANDSAEWSESNKVQLNVGNTNEMIVTSSRKHPDADTPPPSLKIEGCELQRISCAKGAWGHDLQRLLLGCTRRLHLSQRQQETACTSCACSGEQAHPAPTSSPSTRRTYAVPWSTPALCGTQTNNISQTVSRKSMF